MTTDRRIQQSMQGATAVALKVLSAVPISEPWSREQIVAELRRTGHVGAVQVVHGCLDNLRGRGLIKEPSAGLFIRVQPRARLSIDQPDEEAMTEPKPPSGAAPMAQSSAPHDPMATLADLAARLRKMAEAVEDLALDVQQQMDSIRADGEKLRQLRELLKGMA